MKHDLEQAVAAAVKDLFGTEVAVELTRPDEQFGDYATNVALQLSKQLGKSPREIADALAGKLRTDLADNVADVSVAGPGFLNLTLTDSSLVSALHAQLSKSPHGQEILVEFGDPNPFKAMHLGHLYTAIVGDAVAHLLEAGGAEVKRVSYHGDVGMHVARAIWAIRKRKQTAADWQPPQIDTEFGQYYAEGTKAYESSEEDAEQIRQVNAHVYARDDPEINQIYDDGCVISFAYFDKVFHELGIVFVKRYLESVSTAEGMKFVRANMGTVFEESDGAVVYRGEKVGLHTRVFINSKGLPTYEAKDLGLAELKNQDFPKAAKSIIITAHEQTEYFKVMLAALGEIDQALARKTRHIPHGFLSLTTGKMSSRTGDVYAASNLLATVRETVATQYPDAPLDVQTATYLAAVKYTFLKNRIGGDIVFDVQESIALEGNSGPYLQYAHARARSILAKAQNTDGEITNLQAEERSLLRKITEYPEAVEQATAELMPHHICTYLYELAQTFNRFYEHNHVMGDQREAVRLQLVARYADTLKNGLSLLGITAPERM